MPARRMRVELFDSEGNRYSISFEGQITRDKALRLLDLVELLGGVPSGSGNPGPNPAPGATATSKFERLRLLVQKHFPMVWFSSKEVQAVFEQELKEPITLSTVATYLSRMADKGLVLKSGSPNSLKYKAVTGVPQATLRQQIL
jgi:hypothetical protein